MALIIAVCRPGARQLPQLLLQIRHLALPAHSAQISHNRSATIQEARGFESGAPGGLGWGGGLRMRRRHGNHGRGSARAEGLNLVAGGENDR
jgi:hypothetical protein